MNEFEPQPEKYLLSEAESQFIFEKALLGRRFAKLHSVDSPSVHFFGAQPGAGKSAIQDVERRRLVSQDGPNTVMKIIGDELRPYHPKWQQLLAENDELAAFYTDRDSARWVEKSIAYSQELQPNVILEGTLRNPDVTLGSATEYAKLNFRANLHVPVVHEFESRTRIFRRYFGQIEEDGHGRYTIPEAHDRAFVALPTSLATIAAIQVFETINLYDAVGTPLAVIQQGSDRAVDEIENVLTQVRGSLPPNIEELLKNIADSEEAAQNHGRANAARDLAQLRSEIEASI